MKIKPRHWTKLMLNKLEKIKSDLGGSGSVLDIGAGNGDTILLFDESWIWTGIDIDPRDQRVIHGDAHKLNFKNSEFDLIVTRATLHYLHSPFVAVKEFGRVLRSGGYIFGTVAFLEHEHGQSHFHMTQYGVRKLLEEGGFEAIEVIPTPNWTVVESMNILPYTKVYRRLKSKLLFSLRRTLIRLASRFRKGESKERAKRYLSNDEARFAGSFIFIGKRREFIGS